MARDSSLATPLHYAALTVDSPLQMVELFIDNDASLFARNEFGRIPLHQAVITLPKKMENGLSLKDAMRLLHLLTGEDTASKTRGWKRKDNEGNCALHLAAKVCNKEIVEHIAKEYMAAGVDLAMRNRAGRTPIQQASFFHERGSTGGTSARLTVFLTGSDFSLSYEASNGRIFGLLSRWSKIEYSQIHSPFVFITTCHPTLSMCQTHSPCEYRCYAPSVCRFQPSLIESTQCHLPPLLPLP